MPVTARDLGAVLSKASDGPHAHADDVGPGTHDGSARTLRANAR